jgi:hypothetical protein
MDLEVEGAVEVLLAGAVAVLDSVAGAVVAVLDSVSGAVVPVVIAPAGAMAVLGLAAGAAFSSLCVAVAGAALGEASVFWANNPAMGRPAIQTSRKMCLFIVAIILF